MSLTNDLKKFIQQMVAPEATKKKVNDFLSPVFDPRVKPLSYTQTHKELVCLILSLTFMSYPKLQTTANLQKILQFQQSLNLLPATKRNAPRR